MTMILGTSTHEPESLHLEYKEFRLCYSPGDNFETIYHNLEENIEKSLYAMLDKYVVKNLSSFINAGVNGVLRFGIADNGMIIGVPTRDPVSLRRTVETFISGFNQGITVELTPVEIDSFINFDYSSTDASFFSLLEHNRKCRMYQKKYQQDKEAFLNLLCKYRASLSYLFTDPDVYSDFLDYLHMHGVFEMFQDQLPPKINLDQVSTLKNDRTHIIYWAVRFRDGYTNHIIRKYKPSKDPSYRMVNVYYEMIKSFLPMVPHIVDIGYEFYVITLRVNCDSYVHAIPCDGVFYKREYSPKSGPYCTTF